MRLLLLILMSKECAIMMNNIAQSYMAKVVNRQYGSCISDKLRKYVYLYENKLISLKYQQSMLCVFQKFYQTY